MLSGKYIDGARPAGSRWTYMQRKGIFRDTEIANSAVKEYVEVAKTHGFTPSQLALAWCNQVDGVTSTIIGATNLDQLKENVAAFSKPLSEEVLADINIVFRRYPVPY
jgi:aryl-alcohol dehydrogenase-like predicted oxidoreductase